MPSQSSSEAANIAALVDQQLSAAAYIPLREVLQPFLVPPAPRTMQWHGGTGSGDVRCWVVADLRPKKEGMTLVYSEGGHGSYGNPWGIVMKTDQWVGRDDAWFSCLEDAAINAGIWEGKLPPEYEIR